jgi:hypothetical protein
VCAAAFGALAIISFLFPFEPQGMTSVWEMNKIESYITKLYANNLINRDKCFNKKYLLFTFKINVIHVFSISCLLVDFIHQCIFDSS